MMSLVPYFPSRLFEATRDNAEKHSF